MCVCVCVGFREMGSFLDLQSEIDLCLINGNSIGGIPAPEVLNASESEPEWSGNLEYF